MLRGKKGKGNSSDLLVKTAPWDEGILKSVRSALWERKDHDILHAMQHQYILHAT